MRILIIVSLLSGIFISFNYRKSKDFFIAVNGNDTHPGTKAEPFASVAAAQKAVRAFKQKNPGYAVNVRIEPGVYQLTAPVIFTNEDGGSHNAPVNYMAATDQAPVFTGAKKITGWSLLKDASVLNKIPLQARNKIYMADLSVTGITDLGDPTEAGKRPELFCNNQLQTLARWPNAGFAIAGKVKGQTMLPPTYIKVNGTREGIFEYTGAQKNNWAGEQDIRISGYFYWDWAEGFQKVKTMDTLSHTISLEEPYHNYGYKDGFRYFALNLLNEIDTAGEWYIDRQKSHIYWYPPAGVEPEKPKCCYLYSVSHL